MNLQPASLSPSLASRPEPALPRSTSEGPQGRATHGDQLNLSPTAQALATGGATPAYLRDVLLTTLLNHESQASRPEALRSLWHGDAGWQGALGAVGA